MHGKLLPVSDSCYFIHWQFLRQITAPQYARYEFDKRCVFCAAILYIATALVLLSINQFRANQVQQALYATAAAQNPRHDLQGEQEAK